MLVLVFSCPGPYRGVVQLDQAEHVFDGGFLAVAEGVLPQPRAVLVQAQGPLKEAGETVGDKVFLGFHDEPHAPRLELCV